MVNTVDYKKVKHTFDTYFANTTLVLTYDRIKTPMRIATKLPNDINTKDIRIYNYNMQRNSYDPIETTLQLDSSGYLYFNAPQGTIVITSGDFRKA